jgi:4-diphosphocytidyl-2-C-methyl-D-erythritol kinase
VSKKQFTLPAFAKINLSLRILGRRAEDGYHEIDTILQTVTLADDLIFEQRDDNLIEIQCDSPGIPTDEGNLVYRAALNLRERYEVKSAGATIKLIKRIPAGGGLGGGSSNAAIALLGLARLWQIEINRDELISLGKSLGADVPFFFTGGTARGTGIGTEIISLDDVPPMHLLIITPNEHVSTAEAYKAMRAPVLTSENRAVILSGSRAEVKNAESLLYNLQNDFERVIFTLRPRIEQAASALIEIGARRASLSGSGASVFGVFDDEDDRDRAQALLRHNGDWRMFNCTTLARDDYKRRLSEAGKSLF